MLKTDQCIVFIIYRYIVMHIFWNKKRKKKKKRTSSAASLPDSMGGQTHLTLGKKNK